MFVSEFTSDKEKKMLFNFFIGKMENLVLSLSRKSCAGVLRNVDHKFERALNINIYGERIEREAAKYQALRTGCVQKEEKILK